jgi:DNA-binding beta-propeller fold protein YncE
MVGSVARRRGARLSVAVVALALICCSPAQALTHAGHVFAGFFAAPGAGEGQLSHPADVATDEAAGLVYVSDAGNDRVEVFRRTGAASYQYISQFTVRDPGPIAVDNSTDASDPSPGEVYVAGAANKEEEEEGQRNTLFVYSPAESGALRKIRSFKFKEKGGEELEEEFEENISGVDVDAGGTLWVYWEEEGVIDGFEKQLTAAGKSKLAWNPSLRRSMEERFECFARPAFAVAADTTSFYVGYERRNAREECPGEEAEATPDSTVVAKLDAQAPVPATLIAELDHRDTTGAAVDSSDEDLYLDNATSVAAYAPDGTLIQRIGSGELLSGAGLAVDARDGEVLVADASEDRVAVFGLEGTPHEPTIDRLSSQNLGPSSSELSARIDPGGVAAEYHFQYGTSPCAQNPTACVDLPAAKLAAAYGDVSVSAQLHGLRPATAYYYRVIASNALAPDGISASSTFTTLPSPGALPDGRGWELVSPAEKHGSTIEMAAQLRGGSIQASADGGRLAWLAAGPVISEPEGNRSFELSQLMSVRESGGWSTHSLETPHTRGWGLLLPSPGEYHFFSEDLSSSLVAPTEYEQGKTEGVVEHPALSPLATEKTMYLHDDLPADGGFLPLVTAQNDTAGTKFGGGLDFLGASSDLQHVVFHSKVGLGAAAPTAAGLYMWQKGEPLSLISVLPDGAPAPDGGFIEPSLGAAGGLNAHNAISEDGRRVFWTDGEGRALYMRDTVQGKTIELNAAQGHQATEPGLGGEEVPEPSEAEPGREVRQVRFEGASADGSTIFFTDTARLTEDSTQQPTGQESPTDLYEFHLSGEDPLRGRLRDLSAGAAASSGDVLNIVPGISDDGSSVYFVANAALAPGATPGQCAREPEFGEPSPPGATCNLYVSEADPAHPGQRHTRFIATLSSEDAGDWGAGATSHLGPKYLNLSAVTSRVSTDGRYLTFMSQRSLTGYDNRDAVSGQPDEEVYLYDAASGRLLCASCNSSGGEGGGWTRPHGVFDTELAGEGLGLLADRGEIWQQRWLAGSLPSWGFNFNGGSQPAALYQPRYLSNSGRMFFNSADDLVDADRNSKEDVYEYEPQGVGSCTDSAGCTGLISSGSSERESAFLDASESGDDVFFLTASPLVAADTDRSIDIYDAHVCSDGSPCLQYPTASTTSCESTASCRSSEAPAPQSAGAPASATFSGPGSPAGAPEQQVRGTSTVKPTGTKPLTRVQKLARALKTCRKQHAHSNAKRTSCERQARKKYGPVKRGAVKRTAHKSASRSSSSNGKVR